MKDINTIVYYGPGKLVGEKRPMPLAGKGEICIRVEAVSICGSDIGAYKNASDRFEPPLILGHEFSGVIHQIGEDVTRLKVGQRVTVNPMIYCRNCFYCERGLINSCNNRRGVGTTIMLGRCNGAFAEYIVLPEFAAYELPASISFVQGALLEPLSVAFSAAQKGGFTPGETDVVIGVGPIGLLIVQALRALGAGKIIAVDMVQKRLDTAIACGADMGVKFEERFEQIREATNGIGADKIIISTGNAALPDGINMVRNAGSIVLLGLSKQDISVDFVQVVSRGISIYGSFMFTREIHSQAIQMMAEGKIDIAPIVTSIRPLSEAAQAFKDITTPGTEEIKIVLKP